MGDRETIGIVTVLAGVLLVIGAVRGTWRKLFQDVVLGAAPSPAGVTGPGPVPDAPGGPVSGGSGCFDARGASVPCYPGGPNPAPNPYPNYTPAGTSPWPGFAGSGAAVSV